MKLFISISYKLLTDKKRIQNIKSGKLKHTFLHKHKIMNKNISKNMNISNKKLAYMVNHSNDKHTKSMRVTLTTSLQMKLI